MKTFLGEMGNRLPRMHFFIANTLMEQLPTKRLLFKQECLCSADHLFIWRGADYSKDNAIKSLKGDIHFIGKNEYDEELKIDIESSFEEVILDITHFDGVKDKTYMRSNAFIFDDPNKVYYFNSHQIITTTPKEKNLGKVVDINIQLRQDNCNNC